MYFIYMCIYRILLFSLFKTPPFSLFPFLLSYFVLTLPTTPQFAKEKKSCLLFPDSKDYHSGIFSLITPFAQQPGRDTQAAWQKQEACVFGNHSSSHFSPEENRCLLAGLWQCPQRGNTESPLSSWHPSGSTAALKPAQAPGALQ